MKILMIALVSGASLFAFADAASAGHSTNMRGMHHSMMHHHMMHQRTALRRSSPTSENKQTATGGQPGGSALTGG